MWWSRDDRAAAAESRLLGRELAVDSALVVLVASSSSSSLVVAVARDRDVALLDALPPLPLLPRDLLEPLPPPSPAGVWRRCDDPPLLGRRLLLVDGLADAADELRAPAAPAAAVSPAAALDTPDSDVSSVVADGDIEIGMSNPCLLLVQFC